MGAMNTLVSACHDYVVSNQARNSLNGVCTSEVPADLQSKDLTAMLPEVEQFTINEYIPALTKGSQLTDAERANITKRKDGRRGCARRLRARSTI